jgi:GDPmannose 4,6-dehydratase
MGKKALITGITGQDGAYLADLLLKKGYDVYGFYRRVSSPNIWRLLSLGINKKVKLIEGDMTDKASIMNAVIKSDPDEIYNLAAQSFVGASFAQPLVTAHVDGLAVVMFLEVIKQLNPKIKLYQASTSELYGNGKAINAAAESIIYDENSIFWPTSPYAAAKLYSYHQVRIYREGYNLFAINGILFNHESPLRGLEFVTRKISNALARIKLGLQRKLILGNIDSMRDWGYAPEYVEAMWLMMQQKEPNDYVIATGQSHSVREFIDRACDLLELNSNEVIVQDKKFLRPIDVNYLLGDSTKAKRELGWSSNTNFNDLVEIMVKTDFDRWERHLNGEIFPWDAINDPEAY